MKISSNDIVSWKKMKSGDKGALESLYSLYYGPLYNYGRKMGFNVDALDDSIHDLFVNIWETRARLADPDSVKFYLFRSLRRNLTIKIDKSTLSIDGSANFDHLLKSASESIEDEWIESEKRSEKVKVLQKVLRSLPARQYEALVLRYYDNFSYEDIAKIMNVKEQTVRNFINRALSQLKIYIQELISVFLCVLLLY